MHLQKICCISGIFYHNNIYLIKTTLHNLHALINHCDNNTRLESKSSIG